jgi:hypothetical protein
MLLGEIVIGADKRTGILIPGDFSLVTGVRKATVTISPPYIDTNYIVTFSVEATGNNTFSPVHESRLVNSFIVNLGTASLTGLSSITWVTEPA